MLGGLLAFLVALSILIVVHELGHYLVAKWTGVHVEVFSVGYGKRLFGKKIGGTDFRVSLFPLGGYAKMYGDITEEVAADMVKPIKKGKEGDKAEPEKTEPADEISQDKSFFAKTRLQRFAILIAGSVFNILFAIVLIWITNLAGRDIPAYKYETPVLGGTVENSPADKAGLLAGDKILSINGQEMKTWEDAEIKIMLSPKQDLNIVLDRNGEIRKYKVTPEEVTKNKIGYIGLLKDIPLVVGKVSEGSPAEQMGMKAGDTILKIDDVAVTHWSYGVLKINDNPDTEMTLVVKRDNQTLTLRGKTTSVEDPETGKKLGKFGFIPTAPMIVKKYSLGEGLISSIEENIRYAKLFFVSIGKLITGKLSIRSMSGIIETTKISVEVAEQGALPFIFLIGFISLNLGLFNLAPIPMLDGGAVFILLLEGIRRKDFSLVTKERILQIGFFFLMVLVVVILYFDIVKVLF